MTGKYNRILSFPLTDLPVPSHAQHMGFALTMEQPVLTVAHGLPPGDDGTVSVLIRTMGRPTLAKAVASALDQTWSRVVVKIVVASGQGSDSLKGLPTDSRIEINTPARALGRSEAANQLLDMVRTEFALFLDDDDWLLPNHLERLVQAFRWHPNAVAVYAGVECLRQTGETLERVKLFDEPISRAQMQLRNGLPIHSTLFRREAVQQTPAIRFDTALECFEDWDFWLQLLERGAFVYLPGVSAVYLINDSEGSGHEVSGTRRREMLEAFGQRRLAHWSTHDVADLIDLVAGQIHRLNVQEMDLAEKRNALNELDARYRRLAKAHELQTQAAYDLEETLRGTQAHGQALQAQLQDLSDHFRALNQLHAELVGSLSWRITHPLRVAQAVARKISAGYLARQLLRCLPVPVSLKQRIKNRLAAHATGARALGWLTGEGPVATTAAQPVFDKEQVRAQAQADLELFLQGDGRIDLACTAAQPTVSVIVVLYNQAGLTLQCLQSLSHSTGVPFETIIVDNASSDAMPRLLERVDGARLLLQTENLGFLRAVNLAADYATGEHLLLLNNDAMVEPTTLARACARLAMESDVGAVGGPIHLWDGRLQEAGSIVWNDGSCLGYGRGDSPLLPPYQFVRDVDYCSGAFLLARRALFELLGRFDEVFAPAYYEESDFCVRLWEHGYRVVYDPAVRIRHFEFASDVNSGQAMALQARNRAIFVERHTEFLATRLAPTPRNVLLARQVVPKGRKRVLIIDDRVPYPSLGRGYPRACMIAHLVAEHAGALTYYPLQTPEDDWSKVYTALPEQTEIMLNQGLPGLAAFLEQRAGTFDTIIVSRPHNMEPFAAIRRRHPHWFAGVTVAYDAEALFSLREIERARVMGKPLTEAQGKALIAQELELATTADRIVAVSEVEAQQYRAAGCRDVIVLGHALQVQPTAADFGARSGFLFVGAITQDDCPNGDSILWFLDQVWPTVQAQLGEAAELDIVGVCESPQVQARRSATVRLCGRVDDLAPYFERRRVFIVPTRFAAGVPHKAHEAASRGLPMVTTPLIASQLNWTAELLVGADAESFAQACVRLHQSQDDWTRIRQAALAAIEHDCSAQAFAASVAGLLR